MTSIRKSSIVLDMEIKLSNGSVWCIPEDVKENGQPVWAGVPEEEKSELRIAISKNPLCQAMRRAYDKAVERGY